MVANGEVLETALDFAARSPRARGSPSRPPSARSTRGSTPTLEAGLAIERDAFVARARDRRRQARDRVVLRARSRQGDIRGALSRCRAGSWLTACRQVLSRDGTGASSPGLGPWPLRSSASDARASQSQPDWYRRAVFYEVPVRGFYDANGDGIGDLRGLQEKLEYLQWLGVDCLWLLPYYPSPMRDGGYDISDFFTIHPDLGTTDDLVLLLGGRAPPRDQDHRRPRDEPHERRASVVHRVAKLAARTTASDWYVWSDDDKRWPEARVVFVDVETSNWTWDPVRQQFFWHRFYSHQPDLNYDNPDVEAAMLGVVRHWLDLGLDGFRLDAVSYLYQRDGTTGESLPETHALLRRLRKEVDSAYPEAVLLAEANQWPADLVDYFGQGDECQMCFHFPLMPRLFMAVRREQRFPVTEILGQSPADPADVPVGDLLAQPRRALAWRRSQKKSATTWLPSTRRTRGCSGTWASAGGSPRCSTATVGWPSCSSRCCSRCPGARSSTTATSC